jgi:hypothetical protein
MTAALQCVLLNVILIHQPSKHFLPLSSSLLEFYQATDLWRRIGVSCNVFSPTTTNNNIIAYCSNIKSCTRMAILFPFRFILCQFPCYIYRMSQELRSQIRDLIPELFLSKKYHTHMDSIHNVSGVMSF